MASKAPCQCWSTQSQDSRPLEGLKIEQYVRPPSTIAIRNRYDLTGRPLQLHGLRELLPATLTDRFVGAFVVVVPSSRFRWIVSAAEGAFQQSFLSFHRALPRFR